MFDIELEKFKVSIDLRVYAANEGYELDRKESSLASSVMRHPNGDKIIVKRDRDGHFVYFSVRGTADEGGTIIDFIGNRRRLKLGAIRKELRPWVGLSRVKPIAQSPEFPALKESSRDRHQVEAAYAKMRDALKHPYLEDTRAVPAAILQRPRFVGRIKIDARGNAIFPHFDNEGLCGFEIKNVNFTGFSPSGTKGLWLSHALPVDDCLVVTESAIDALSYAALFGEVRTRLGSIGGNLNRHQPEMLRAAIGQMPAGSEIVSAMDLDEGGAKLAALLRDTFDRLGRADLRFKIQTPTVGKDFNDQLRARSKL